MRINTDHSTRIKSDDVRDPVLQASLPSSRQATVDHGANVSLNDVAKWRIVSLVVFFFPWHQAPLPHEGLLPAEMSSSQ
jgi:hypothetical protein